MRLLVLLSDSNISNSQLLALPFAAFIKASFERLSPPTYLSTSSNCTSNADSMPGRAMLWITFLYYFFVPIASAQITWQKNPDPVLAAWRGNIDSPSSFHASYDPCVLYDSASSMYRMWFSYQAYGFGAKFNIGYALSADGINWFSYAKNPVLRVGADGSFDAAGVFNPFVIAVKDGWRMYYTGNNGSVSQVGVALSSDGVTWRKHSENPILTVQRNTWESSGCSAASVFYDGERYRMFYSGYDGTVFEIGCATSEDGFSWMRNDANPIVRRGGKGAWDAYSVTTVAMFHAKGKYHLLYGGGTGFPVGYAASEDGITWTKFSGNPVFFPGPTGAWDNSRVEYGAVLCDGNRLRFWYSGSGYSAMLGSSVWQIGYATSGFDVQMPTAGSLVGFLLGRVHRLPDRDVVEIPFTIPSTRHVILRVFDMRGNEVATLVNQSKVAGSHLVQWNTKSLPAGIYCYRLRAGGFVSARKTLLIK